MFEAYFNYLGHFTMIPNKVVDTLVYKALRVGGEEGLVGVMEIFDNHNYLMYFPSYQATAKVFKHLVDHVETKGEQLD